MHDQSLEQRLRSALQAEGDGLAFTITAAELERRLALRRRGGLSPLASLGLAAAVGVGLLGLVGAAGGWFEQRTAVTPPVSPSAAGPESTATPSDRTGRDTLPTLDELVGARDPASIIRAQSVGPEHGPDAGTNPDPRSVRFAPVSTTGTYAVDLACIGSVDLQLQLVKGNPDVAGRSEPFSCDGAPSSGLVDLVAGDSLGIKTSGSPSWRIVVQAPAGAQSDATTIDTRFGPPAGDVSLSNGTSETVEPTFVGTPAPLDVIVPIELQGVAARRSYRVLTSCAGPGPLRYLFGSRAQGGPLAIDATSTTAVACDGGVHTDDLGLTERNGGQIFVVADPRVVWRVMVTSEIPPVSTAADDATWGMHEAIGPTIDFDSHSFSMADALEGTQRDLRVVISCLGGAGVDVTVRDLDPAKPAVGSFHVDCGGPDATTVAKAFTLHRPEYIVEVDPTGEMWLAATVQGRVPASPAP